jgi:hypothetical protein
LGLALDAAATKRRRLGGRLFGRKARAGGGFEVIFRFDGPDKPLSEKTWKLPDIEKAR